MNFHSIILNICPAPPFLFQVVFVFLVLIFVVVSSGCCFCCFLFVCLFVLFVWGPKLAPNCTRDKASLAVSFIAASLSLTLSLSLSHSFWLLSWHCLSADWKLIAALFQFLASTRVVVLPSAILLVLVACDIKFHFIKQWKRVGVALRMTTGLYTVPLWREGIWWEQAEGSGPLNRALKVRLGASLRHTKQKSLWLSVRVAFHMLRRYRYPLYRRVLSSPGSSHLLVAGLKSTLR